MLFFFFLWAVRLAKLKTDSVFTAPCNASVLYPTTGGNIHAFTAITPCAVLDVLGPPYSAEDGRDCTYYKDYPRSSYSSKYYSKIIYFFYIFFTISKINAHSTITAYFEAHHFFNQSFLVKTCVVILWGF